jgi:hypothetical protein
MLDNYEFLLAKREEFANEPIIPPPLVRGDDLIALGLKPGPKCGGILEAGKRDSSKARFVSAMRRSAGCGASTSQTKQRGKTSLGDYGLRLYASTSPMPVESFEPLTMAV